MSPKTVSAGAAISLIENGQKVFIHGAAMTPAVLTGALISRAPELSGVELMHLHTEGDASYASDRYKSSFHTNSFFVAANIRNYVNKENADYVPVCLSEAHQLFRQKAFRPDVALVQVSPPDRLGYCTLGASLDIVHDALCHTKILIAEVNRQAPVTYGDSAIHVSKFDFLVESDRPLFTSVHLPPGENATRIGQYVSTLVSDGSTLQLGIGNIPDAVLAALSGHKHLGVHTEMFSDGIIPLVEAGVITGEKKKCSAGKITTSFVLGTQKVYDFINKNKMVEMRRTSYTNNPDIIRMNPRVVAVNSAIEIDLTGQVCAESIGYRQFSGVGGQLDFMRAAALSEGGKPIVAMESVTSTGESKIVPALKKGAAVTTPRSMVHYVVTEYGIADLFGKNLRERARALIEIAHPMHREELCRSAAGCFGHL